MERKIALVGYLQPIEGVASASLTTVDQYLNSNSPPSYAFKEYESINAKLKTMQPEKHSGKRGQIIKELIQSILKEATKQSLAGKAPSTPPFAPLALLSLHRQIFDTDGALVPGPIDQVFTIAPLETVEVRLEEVQRLTFEETKETTTSSNEDATVESRQSKELTDRFLDRVERSASANVSANASVTYGIFSGGVNASKTWSDAQSTSKEMVSVIASELAQRTSESISRTFSLRTRSTEEITRSNSYRKLIQNPTADVINYGLVKYYRTATIRSQLFRRYLCWRFTIENPGSLVALPGLITPQVVPNGATLSVGRPPQASIAGTDTRVSAVKLPNLGFRAKAAAPAKSTIEELAEFGVTQVQVSLRAIGNASLVDVVGVRRRIQVVRPATKGLPEMTWSANYKIANVIRPGSLSASSEVYFDFRLEDVEQIPAAWPKDASDKPLLIEAIRRDINLIIEEARSGNGTNENLLALVRSERAANKRSERDLRLEESLAIQREVAVMLNFGTDASQQLALSGVFDFSQMSSTALNYSKSRADIYPTLAESPAPLGASIGWQHVFDADERRNRFVNADLLEIVLPIVPGRETEAASLLKDTGQIVEGAPDSISNLLKDIEKTRQQEMKFGNWGPDDVLNSQAPNVLPVGLVDFYPVSTPRQLKYPAEGFGYSKI